MKEEFTINVKITGKNKGKLNVVSDTNNIDYVLDMVRVFLNEVKEKA